jgi:hypothetical protein
VATLQQLSKAANLSNIRLTDLSPGSLWLTDLNDEVLSRCRDNLNLACSECSHSITSTSVKLANSLSCKDISSSHPDVNYLKLDWSASIDLESSSMFTALIHQKIVPDIILGADVVCAILFLFVEI